MRIREAHVEISQKIIKVRKSAEKTAPITPEVTRLSRKTLVGLFFRGSMKTAVMDIISITIEAKNQLTGVIEKLKLSLPVIPTTSYDAPLPPQKNT